MSVQRRPKTGVDSNGKVRWVARIYDLNGREHSKTFPQRNRAVQWELEQKSRLQAGGFVDPAAGRVTVETIVQNGIDIQTRPASKRIYKNMQQHLGVLADMPAGRVTTLDIQKWVATLSERLKPATVRTCFKTLSTCFNQACREKRITVNPCKGVKLPAAGPSKVNGDTIPTAGQISNFVHTLNAGGFNKNGAKRGARDAALAVRVAAATGLRIGEAIGLVGADVDTLNHTIRVSHQRGGAPLKTAASARVVTVDEDTMAAISEQMDTTGGGLLIRCTANLIRGYIREGVRRGMLPRGCTFHTLRHFHATTLLGAGLSPRVVSERLGHADVSITLNVYSHLLPGDDRRAADIVGGLLRAKYGQTGGGLAAVK